MKYSVDFSIIIPTYNRADTLLVAVNSLLQQRHRSFEIIIVDDGSTDNTEDVIAQIQDERVCYFKKENEERSIARNYGIEKAQGRYVGFLDADDYVLPNHLEEAFSLLTRLNSPEVFHMGYRIEDESGHVRNRVEMFLPQTQDNLMLENPFICNAIIIRNDIIKKYQFINSPYATFAEDWYLWIVLASRYTIYFNNVITSVVVEHANRSLSGLNPLKVKKSIDIVVKSLLNDEKVQKKYGKEINNFASIRYLFCSNLALENRKYRLFFICLIISIYFNPKQIIKRLLKKFLSNN